MFFNVCVMASTCVLPSQIRDTTHRTAVAWKPYGIMDFDDWTIHLLTNWDPNRDFSVNSRASTREIKLALGHMAHALDTSEKLQAAAYELSLGTRVMIGPDPSADAFLVWTWEQELVETTIKMMVLHAFIRWRDTDMTTRAETCMAILHQKSSPIRPSYRKPSTSGWQILAKQCPCPFVAKLVIDAWAANAVFGGVDLLSVQTSGFADIALSTHLTDDIRSFMAIVESWVRTFVEATIAVGVEVMMEMIAPFSPNVLIAADIATESAGWRVETGYLCCYDHRKVARWVRVHRESKSSVHMFDQICQHYTEG